MAIISKMKKSKGSFSVEAAIMMPAFFLACMPFLLLLRMMIVQISLEDAMQSSLRQMALEGYLLEKTEVLPQEESLAGNVSHQLMLKGLMQAHLPQMDLTKWGVEGGWEGVSLWESRFFFEEGDHTALLLGAAEITYHNPFSFFSLPKGHIRSLGRCFLGRDSSSSGGEESGSEEEETLVYLIGAGTHFHQYSCYLIQKQVQHMALESARLSGYSPCSYCIQGSLSSGGQVYLTPGGEHYHRAGCYYLFPNLSQILKEEALAMGYIPCGICYGEQVYFKQ